MLIFYNRQLPVCSFHPSSEWKKPAGGGLSSFPQIPRKQADSPGRKTRNLGRLARFRPGESVAWGIRGLSEKDKKQAVSDGSDIPGFWKEVRSLSVSIC